MEAQMKRPRTWRKLVKKLQRKKKRQKLARDRDKKLEEEELQKRNDPSYKQWLEHQEHMEELQRIADEKEQQENEEQWLRRELLAQKQFQREQQMRLAEEKAQEELREQQYKKLKELEEAKKRQQEERQRKAEEAAKELEETIKICYEYLQDPGMATPTRMQGYIETRPGEKQCEFYKKTQCCRFGYRCSHSHTRPLLSNIILIRNFFQHRLLDQQQHEEYSSAEEQLEMGEGDLRNDYDDFCADVWPELEQFGEIVNFRTARNVQPHARGTVFVEYKDKRSALKAFINLQSRYYAAKRLNVEFAHITHWRTAVCGIFQGFSLARNCPKGAYCNYLHILQNPDNKYNTPYGSLDRSQRSSTRGTSTRLQTPIISWNSVSREDAATPSQRRNWRWSESPETENATEKTPTVQNTTNSNKKVLVGIPDALDTSHKSPNSKKPSPSSRYKRKSRSRSRESHTSQKSGKEKSNKWDRKENNDHKPSSQRNSPCSDRAEIIVVSSSSSSDCGDEYHSSSYKSKTYNDSDQKRPNHHESSKKQKHKKRKKSRSRDKSPRKRRSHHRHKQKHTDKRSSP